MVNRELIRLKTVQIVYSYYLNGAQEKGAQGINAVEKELLYSLDKAYDLYHTMLLLLLEIKRAAIEEVEFRQMRNKQLGIDNTVSTRLANNRLLQKLNENEQLRDFLDKNNQTWVGEEALVKDLTKNILQSSDYEAYLETEDNFDNDKEFIRKAYRTFICDNDAIAAALEDMNIYWNDDKYIIDTFVLKTIKFFQADSTPNMPLLPEYEHNEDKEYAVKLLRHAIKNASYYRSLIEEYSVNWDMDRIALMDTVIIQTGLAEIIAFPTIPIPVSINEYINISKMYSTQKNWTFVNATLDKISKFLVKEHKVMEK